MKFVHLTEVGSTNDEVRQLAEQGENGPLWLRADSQTHGRGRHGRSWSSKTGNLYASGLFALGKAPLAGAHLGFAAALAISDTVLVYAPEANITLKWPNDVLIDGAKVSGILLETGQNQNGHWLIVGIGINLISHPVDTPYRATHLLQHIPLGELSVPEPIFTGADAVLAVLSAKFEYWRDLYSKSGFSAMRQPWINRAQGIDEIAHVRLADRSFHAKLLGLGENGELQVEHDNGTIEAIYAGDVFPSTPPTET